ncbi:MAG TPA: hypothetical protein VL346_05715 [Acidobacteriaceae bacterium]|nr:hypothetical protein [Acidobacteriaceae bacterium]
MSANAERHDDQDAVSEGRQPVGKVIGLCLCGWLAGSILPLAGLVLCLHLWRAVAQQPASTGMIWAAAIAGVLLAIVGSWIGASFYRPQALGIGASIAATLAAFSMWSWYTTPTAAHWLQAIAVLLMAPAAQFAAIFRRTD